MKQPQIIRCPYCNESYFSQEYTISTCLYSPAVYKDGELISKDSNYHTTTCKCLNCNKKFGFTEHMGEITIHK